MATASQVDSLELSMIIPFLKVNPFDDYVVVLPEYPPVSFCHLRVLLRFVS